MVEQGIRIDKSAHRRVIIPAIEVIESRLLIVDISTIAQRVDVCQGAHSGDDFTIGIVVIACNNRAAGVYDVHYVTLEVGHVVVHRAVVLHGIGQAAGIIEEVNGIGSPGHAHQLTAGVVVAVGSAVHGLAGSQAVCIVGKAQAAGPIGGGGQISTVDPGKVPAGAVVVAGGVANGIIGDCLAVKGGKQVLPVGITVGVTVGGGAIGGGQNIACAVVDIGVGGVPRCAEQLTLVVVGVGYSALPGSGEGCDVTHAVIGIAILLPAAGHGRYLHGGLDAVNIPVGILPGDGAAVDGSQPPQTIVAHGQGSTHTGGHGVQAAIGRIVGVSLRIRRTIQLPVLVCELVIGVVVLAGAKDASVSFLLLAVK